MDLLCRIHARLAIPIHARLGTIANLLTDIDFGAQSSGPHVVGTQGMQFQGEHGIRSGTHAEISGCVGGHGQVSGVHGVQVGAQSALGVQSIPVRGRQGTFGYSGSQAPKETSASSICVGPHG